MPTIPRTYYTTSKSELSSVPLINGQVISIWDNDEVWYDAPINGQRDGAPVRRKISGVKVVSVLPNDPMTDIVYVYIGDHGTIPESDQKLYDLRVWVNGEWLIVGNNMEDCLVKSAVSNSKFYLAGVEDSSTEQDIFSGDGTTTEFTLSQPADTLVSVTVDGTSVTNAELSDDKTAVVFTTAPASGTDNIEVTYCVDVISSLKKNANVFITNGEINQPTGDIHGNADTATNAQHAGTADLADQASKDTLDQPILGYLRDVTSDDTSGTGSTLTFTTGDNTPITVTTVDTKYNVYTASTAGLVNGTNVTVNQDTSGLILSGDGWINAGSMTIPTAQSAVNDAHNPPQNIEQTYIKGLSYDTSTEELTITKGNDTSTSISIPDTTYSDFTASTPGLVPAPITTEINKFLNSSGWSYAVTPSDIYQGASDSVQDTFAGDGSATTFTLSREATSLVSATVNGTAVTANLSPDNLQVVFDSAPADQAVVIAEYTASGVAGLVPSATTLQQGYYLRGDGTWGGAFATGAIGLVPAPASDHSEDAKFLQGDGAWAIPQDTQDTAGSTDDTTHKLYVVGAQSQSASGTGVPTYSNSNVYIQGNKIYSNGAEVVDLSSAQALTNKTSYNGYVLGSACAKTAVNSVTATDDVPTNNAVIDYVAVAVPNLIGGAIAGKVDNMAIAPEFDSSVAYSVDDWCIYNYSGDQYVWRCKSATTAGADFDDSEWDHYTVIEAIKYLIQHYNP